MQWSTMLCWSCLSCCDEPFIAHHHDLSRLPVSLLCNCGFPSSQYRVVKLGTDHSLLNNCKDPLIAFISNFWKLLPCINKTFSFISHPSVRHNPSTDVMASLVFHLGSRQLMSTCVIFYVVLYQLISFHSLATVAIQICTLFPVCLHSLISRYR